MVTVRVRVKGGKGSGNHGHAGRPNQVGGSAPSSGTTHQYSKGSVELTILATEVQETFPEGPRRKEALEALQPSKWDTVIAMKDGKGKLTGVAAVWTTPDTPNEEGTPQRSFIRIRNMAVKESGHGKVLFSHIAQYAIDHKAGVYLSSLASSRKFYESLGMQEGLGATYYLTLEDLRAKGYKEVGFKGGKGSGNYGHAGRPTKVGGSAPRGQNPTSISHATPPAQARYHSLEELGANYPVGVPSHPNHPTLSTIAWPSPYSHITPLVHIQH